MEHECAENTKTYSQTHTDTVQSNTMNSRRPLFLTRMMMRMAAVPDVDITLAQLGIRLKSTGTMASAP